MTDNSTANTLGDLGRLIQQLMNWGIYVLLGGMYQVFFNVSSAQLFETETIKNFYGRVQLIIGVFMVFKLAVSILQGIMDPDKFMNPKEGFGNFITRVVISLSLLTVLVPINIPNVQQANSFEKYLNNNGLLFGTLYSLQDRILSNNTLGRLILGTTDDAIDDNSSTNNTGKTEAQIQREKLSKSSRIFTSTILKAFLKINLLPAEARTDDDDTNKENWFCGANLSSDAKDAIESYRQLDVDPSTLLSFEMLTVDCEVNNNIFDHFRNLAGHIPIIGGFVEHTRYVFAFNWLASLIIGIVFLVILIGFTVDIAVRSIKLAVLRLLAPIPVISYIEPKSSKDGGMFSSWVKALTSTYLDLFLRLAIVYFVIFLIQDMIANGIVIDEAGGLVGGFSFIFIMLGLFIFAKMAPKFIKDALGLKGTMSNFGLSGILAGAGAIRQGGTIFEAGEAMADATRAQQQAYNQGKKAPELGDAWNSGRDYAAKILTGDQNMSGRRMSRGARHLKRMNISTPQANRMKQEMYAAEAAANRASDLYDRFNKGKYEESELAAALGANYNAADSDAIKREKLYNNKVNLAKEAATKKTDYEDVKGMQKQYGQSRSFEAKYDARRRNRAAAGGIHGEAGGYYSERGPADKYGNHTYRDIPNMQRFRSQEYPEGSATSATTPTGSGVDLNPVGGMGEHTHDE
ncbi:MAG: hypothetical protein SOU84_00065 [Candidatus Faecimonas sp.]|nr:hypothetical protein [Mycoplasmatota bacterium]MDY2907546.1 hypothetical protein [Candidatus Faecimonas sp.]